MSLFHPAYRRDIDGLRALAILSVVAFHAFPEWVTGGFVGVDVFFVISGFLISTIIYRSLEDHKFSFREFYAKRIRRIFPALLLVLSCCFVFGWYVLLDNEFKQLSRHIMGGATFISNFVLYREVDYFDNKAETKPLLHLWSLGIEEQFYIVFPVLVFLVWKIRKHVNPFWLLAALTIVSFTLNMLKVDTKPMKVFYLPKTRFWELLAGCLLAYARLYPQKYVPLAKIKGIKADLLSWLGFCFIIFAVILFEKEDAFPGWRALLPVAGATLLIASGSSAWINQKILSHPCAVWIGWISFPLYLWHWPLLSFARIITGKMPSEGLAMALMLASICLAWLTYRFWETPIRHGKKSRHTVKILLGANIVLLLLGLLGNSPYGASRLSLLFPELKAVEQARGDWEYPAKAAVRTTFDGLKLFKMKGKVAGEVLYLGDSNMEQYMARIETVMQKKKENAYTASFLTIGGCKPIPDTVVSKRENCVSLMPTAEKYIIEKKVKRLVIASYWNTVPDMGFYRDGSKDVSLSDDHTLEKAMDGLITFIQKAKKNGVEKVYLVQNIPTTDEMAGPVFGLSRLALSPHDKITFVKTVKASQAIHKKMRWHVQRVAQKTGSVLLDPVKAFCPHDLCPLMNEKGTRFYKDTSHVTHSYAQEKAHFMDATILK